MIDDKALPQPNMRLIRPLWGVGRFLFRLYFRLKCKGCEKLPVLAKQKQQLILVSNHTSTLDVPLVGLCAGPDFLSSFSAPAKRELFDDGLSGWIVRALGFFPVDRGTLDLSAVRTMYRLLRSGRSIGIAPEGTRSTTGQVLPFRSGFVKVALKTNTPILPVGVHGADKALPRGAVIPLPHEITVHFGDVIDLADYRAQQTQPLTDEDLAEMVRQEVIRLCNDREG